MRGLDSSLLTPVIEPAMPTIIELMYDISVAVRDTAAWIVGQICEHAPESAINELYLKSLLEAMVQGLKSEPRVAANVCWAFVELAKASYDAACKQSDVPNTYCLSQYFELLVEKLLETTTRADGSKVRIIFFPSFSDIFKI